MKKTKLNKLLVLLLTLIIAAAVPISASAAEEAETATEITETEEETCEHDYVTTGAEVTCTEVYYTYTCKICGDVITDVEEGDHHSYQIFESNGDGTHTSYCYRCGLEGSTYDCTDDDGEGYCSVCGYEFPTTTATTASDSDDTADSTSDTTASTATVTSVEIPDTGAYEDATGALACVLGALGIVAAGAVMLLIKARKKAASEA